MKGKLSKVKILDYLVEMFLPPPCISLFLSTSLPFLILLSCFICLAWMRRCSNLSRFCSGWICMAPLVGPVSLPRGRVLSVAHVSCADECLCEADSMCVITNKPPA